MNKPRMKMSAADRAKQFMPFSALKGLDEALRMKEKIIVEKKELSEDTVEQISAILSSIGRGNLVEVVFFDDGEYISVEGIVTDFDPIMKKMTVVKTEIAFECIYKLNRI